MDLAHVTRHLLAGIAQEIGVERSEFKLVIVANEGDKPIQYLAERRACAASAGRA